VLCEPCDQLRVGGHLKYREYVCVPAVSHLQHPVKASSPGELQHSCCANPVISYGAFSQGIFF